MTLTDNRFHPPNVRMLEAMAEFTRGYLDAHECDPEYPVLRALQMNVCSGREQRLWHTLLYMVYGEVLAGQTAYSRVPDWRGALDAPEDTWKLPTAIERRGFRDPRAAKRHITALVECIERAGGVECWLTTGFIGDPRYDWRALMETIMGVWGNGRWAAYTTAEALICTGNLEVEACDLGNAYSSGPRLGLAHLFGAVAGNSADTVARLDRQAEWLKRVLADEYETPMRWEELETVLCNFHELVTGKLYIGRGVDRQLEYLDKFTAMGFDETVSLVRTARLASTIKRAYLGELGGWCGVDQARKRAFLLTGQILVR